LGLNKKGKKLREIISSEQNVKKSLNRKPYGRLLRVIGESTVPLTGSEIMYKMRDIDPSSDWRYVYEMLKELCPTDNLTDGNRLFCLEDLISENYDIRKRSSSHLVTKVKKSFWYFNRFPDQKKKYIFFEHKDTFKTYLTKNTNQEVTTITIKDDNNNLVLIQPPHLLAKYQNVPLARLTDSLEIKMICAIDYPVTKREFNPSQIWYVSLKKKWGKTYAYEGRTVFPYLNLTSIHDSRTAADSQKRTLRKYILNLRGLMLLLLSEEDSEKINCVIKNLAMMDNDIELKRDSNGLLYTINENFPFLSKYFERFHQACRKDFVPSHLKKIAKDLEDILDDIKIKDLKYIVTRKFFSDIESRYWDSGGGLTSSGLILELESQEAVPREIFLYKLSILYYLREQIEDELFLINIMVDDNKRSLFRNSVRISP
jgi:hypothetical protein